jgi:hypothetical protein
MMKKEPTLIIGLLALAGIIALWLMYDLEKKKNNELIKYTDFLKKRSTQLEIFNLAYKEKMNELEKMLMNSDKIEDSLKSKLKELIHSYKNIDEKISNELISAMALIEAKETIKAAFSLAKIVEKLLEEKYKNSEDFKQFAKDFNHGKAKKPTFHDYLEYAKTKKDIEHDQYYFAKGLKEIRNQEGHELGVQKEANWIQSAFLIGIGLILKLGQKII